jgi:hypothetical protein
MGNQIEHNHVKMELFTEIEEDTLFFTLPKFAANEYLRNIMNVPSSFVHCFFKGIDP